ncbi:MAG: hypothetical protein KDC95_10495 [Planctomycetes bacterium]|nr:hypothetical protein [Planctomycetota bacterium]
MNRSAYRRSRLSVGAALLAALGFSSCSGGSSGNQIAGGAFVVLKTEPANNGQIFLNQSIKVFFSNPIDLSTANFNTVAFLVRDQSGNPITEQVVGTFRHGQNDVGDQDPRVLEFVPRLPTNDSYTDGGFRPGRTYVISIIGSGSKSSATLRDQDGRLLSDKSPIQSMKFTTASGTTPKELFTDRTVGGPRVLGIDVSPRIGDRIGLNDLGGEPVEVSIRFNQTVNPASTNVPVGQNLDPINFQIRDKGRVFLEYDDPVLGTRRWIPGSVELPVNDLTSATVTIRPDGVLPNNTLVRVIVEAEFQDVSGESNVNDAAYDRVVGQFRTEERYPAQFDAVAFDFENSDLQDPRATFRDPVADIENGVLQASFDFEGITTVFDFRPTVPEVELNTEFARVVPSNGPEITVIGGVFRFDDVTIPRGTVVRGTGKNPMVWLTTGEFRVDGELRVDGSDGADVVALNSANLPVDGGNGVCGGGNGGVGSPETTSTSQKGQSGFGPGQVKDGGGGGGELSCGAVSDRDFGSGGGGGSHATQGDPGFGIFANDPRATGIGGAGNNTVGGNAVEVPGGLAGADIFGDDVPENDFWGRLVDKDGNVVYGELSAPIGGAGGGGGSHAQVGDAEFVTVYDADTAANGFGGDGAGPNPPVAGGEPMPSLFVDSSKDNDFWGRGFTTTGEVVIGEMKSPRGGGGGGGGGDRSASASCNAGIPNFWNDEKGGGGGGGAGALIIRALGTITIGAEGLISANGGFGGGGEDAGGCRQGGGGGGGAGGIVVLEASRVVIYQHGDLWTKKDTKFALTADGGIGSHSSWQTTARMQKYQTADGRPNRGGFGGMGIVQILTPAGRDDDQTGNVQDDNIFFLDANDQELPNKLAWLEGGDIRPKPVLMPVTYGRTSSWYSRYVATGASVRRVVDSANAGVRSTTDKPALDPTDKNYGPDYYFAGLINSGDSSGYLKTDAQTGLFTFPLVRFGGVDKFAIASLEASATQYRGLDCHRVTVGSSTFPTDNSLANMEGRLFNAAGGGIADFRILWHDDTTLLLDARDGIVPDGAVQVGVAKKFFEVVTEGNAGLGATYRVDVGGGKFQRYPIANVQLGFAFHKDPSTPDIVGNEDNNRFPKGLDAYVYDLETTGTGSVREQLRKLHYPFVKLKVRFNLDYNYKSPDTQPGENPVNALSQRPGLRFVRLPYAY